jgi:hypothetical protein
VAITYPIDFPADIGVSAMTLGLDHAAASAASPFTFQEQVQVHQGNAWDVSMTLDLLERAQADTYNAFLAKLGGREGTFTFCPPGCEEPRGVMAGYGANLLLSPGDLTAVPPWIHTRATAAAAPGVISPDGTENAFKITEDTSNNTHIVQQNITPLPNKWYTWLIWAKAGERSRIAIDIGQFGNYVAPMVLRVDLADGSIIFETDETRRLIEPYPNGWWRLSVWAQTIPNPVGAISSRIYIMDASGPYNYQGDGTSGLYIWGPKLEIGQGPTSYNPNGPPRVNGAGQTGRDLAVEGLPPSLTGAFLPGDFVQIGTKLFRVLDQVDSDADGQATLTLAPPVRVAPADDAPIIYHSPKGIFRAKSNLTPASVAPPFVQSISFAAREAQ